MASSPSAVLKRRKSSLALSSKWTMDVKGKPFKVIVLGQAAVGKTALVVRFVTRRFIWEYDPTLEMTYKHRAHLDAEEMPVDFEVLDTAGQEDINEEKLRWADAYVIVYSITDRVSFEEVMRLKFLCSRAKRHSSYPATILIVGNKQDLVYDRIVARSEAEALTTSLASSFVELSVRESYEEVHKAFEKLYSEFKDRKKHNFLARKKALAKIDLDSNPPRPRERSRSFITLPDILNTHVTSTMHQNSLEEPDSPL